MLIAIELQLCLMGKDLITDITHKYKSGIDEKVLMLILNIVGCFVSKRKPRRWHLK